MDAVLRDLPLVFFTVLAPMGAGAFVAIAASFFTAKFDFGTLQRIDHLTAVPVAFIVAGFAMALFSLVEPATAVNVWAAPGTSPQSDQLYIGLPFVAFALAYLVLAYAGKLTPFSRKALALVVAVVGLGFTAFTGLAFGQAANPIWVSPWPVAQAVGFALIGGAALGAFVLAGARVLTTVVAGTYRGVLVGLIVAGGALALAGLDVMTAEAAMAVPAVADQVAPFTVVANVGVVLTFVAVFLAARGRHPMAFSSAALVVALVAAFAARIAFYVLQPLV